MNDRRSERETILGQSKGWNLSDAHRLQVRLLLLVEESLNSIAESLEKIANPTHPVERIGELIKKMEDDDSERSASHGDS